MRRVASVVVVAIFVASSRPLRRLLHLPAAPRGGHEALAIATVAPLGGVEIRVAALVTHSLTLRKASAVEAHNASSLPAVVSSTASAVVAIAVGMLLQLQLLLSRGRAGDSGAVAAVRRVSER